MVFFSNFDVNFIAVCTSKVNSTHIAAQGQLFFENRLFLIVVILFYLVLRVCRTTGVFRVIFARKIAQIRQVM